MGGHDYIIKTQQRLKGLAMLKIKITSYDETADTFNCDCRDVELGATIPMPIAATLMPYIATELVHETDDLPHGLVGRQFVMVMPLT